MSLIRHGCMYINKGVVIWITAIKYRKECGINRIKGREAERELNFIDDIVQKSHIEKELLENMDGIHTAFDGGAGCGRFSIPFAKQGIHVTHFDISQPMIDKAKELAEKESVLDRITFVKGALEDLSAFADRSFDAPISYTYPKQEQTIGELVRIARKRIMISVSSRLGAFARTIPNEILVKIMNNPKQKKDFLEICHMYDSNPYVCGMGKDNLFAKGEIN